MRRKVDVLELLQELVGDVVGILAIGVAGLVGWMLCAAALARP
jgi:hypothetical protein